MKYAGYGLIIILALALQTTLPKLAFVGAQLEFVLLLTLIFAMFEELRGAKGFAFAGGLLQDLLVGRFIGLYAGTYLLMAVLMSFVTQRLYKENFLVRFFAIFLGTVLGQVLYLFGAASFGFSGAWSWPTWSAVLGTGLVNGLVGMFLYRPLAAVNRRLIYLHELLKRTG